MSRYSFRISNGKFAGVSECAYDFVDRDAAWAEMTKVCSNLTAGLCRGLKPKSDWQMELLDESRKPMFRIRLVAEALD